MAAGINSYCERLGIAVPSLESVRGHREAKPYSLMIVALLEHGGPMTLEEVAARFVAAGVSADVEDALASLVRCRPARAPIYRDGELYELDPHDADLDLWVFRLGLRPPRGQRPAKEEPRPRPPASQRLTVDELDEAWRGAGLTSWSAQRIALAILDAHDRPMPPADVVAFVSARTTWHRLRVDPFPFKLVGAAVVVDADGNWAIAPGAVELAMAREAVRDRVEVARRWRRSTPEEVAAVTRDWRRRQETHAEELGRLRRVIVHAYPVKAPRAVALVDIAERAITTHVELSEVRAIVERADMICGVDVRATLRGLGIDAGERRLGELGPPQKAMGKLKLTTAMFISGSCGIRRPLTDDKTLRALAAKGQVDKLADKLESDARSLFALYEYGMCHGNVRLLRGNLAYTFGVPWRHHDEPTLYSLKREAFDLSMGLVAVVGPTPSWKAPWSTAERLSVVQGRSQYELLLVDSIGRLVDDGDVQRARLEAEIN